ncbi:MAG: hypothetical protein MK312_04315, partial [Roseibacillus sp.]|nr:hypothetical protein [Roseibacillus sp.]
LGHPYYPDVEQRITEILDYVQVLREVSSHRVIGVVDLFAPSVEAYEKEVDPLTRNRNPLTDRGSTMIARHLIRELLGAGTYARLDLSRAEVVAREVQRKAQYVPSVVRPVNAVLYFGVRGRAHEYHAEIPRFHAMVAQSDARIHAMLKDETLGFDPAPLTLPPLVERIPADLL